MANLHRCVFGSTSRTLRLCVLLLMMPWLGCAVDGEGENRLEAQVRQKLGLLVAASEMATGRSNEFPPKEPREFAAWIKKWADGLEPTKYVWFDPAAGVFVDVWGRQIVLVAEGYAVVALGSCGRNGIWEDGKGDDIVFPFAEMNVPTGPAGPTD